MRKYIFKGKTIFYIFLSLLLFGCLQTVQVKVGGNPIAPKFSFEKKVIIGEFRVKSYNKNENDWADVWGVSRVPNLEYVYTDTIEFGEKLENLFEFVPSEELKANHLYGFEFVGGNVRAWGFFGIVEKEGELMIIQFDNQKPLQEIIHEFNHILRK